MATSVKSLAPTLSETNIPNFVEARNRKREIYRMDSKSEEEVLEKTLEYAHLLFFQQSHHTVKFAADPELESYEPIRDENGQEVVTVEEIKRQAASQIDRLKLRRLLCPILQSSSHDLSEIAKIVGAALLPLSLANTIPIPVNPLIYAAIALTVFNAGVSSFCAGLDKDSGR